MLIRALQMRKRKPDISLKDLAFECAEYAIDGIRVCSTGMSFIHPKDEAKAKKSKKNVQDS
jgi:hypothetical protein